MITFVEKEKWTDKDPFIGRTYATIYMIKDGKEYFVVNRVVASQELAKEKQDEKSLDEEVRMYQAFLTRTEGRYFKFYGIYDDPMEMISEMKERRHTFTDSDNIFLDLSGDKTMGFVDFKGNRREVSAAFHYRIYDMSMIEDIKEAIAPIIKKSDFSR